MKLRRQAKDKVLQTELIRSLIFLLISQMVRGLLVESTTT